ncbi:MAG: hypothetical protein GX774_17620 [Armatimonadetes bacterium]|nr:hypothetical protein [Armatimonadota bacterium]
MYLLIQARAETPLGFRAGRDEAREETLSYVPGSALLGALATAHLQLCPDRRDEFADFFLRGGAYLGNLYPALPEETAGAEADELRAARPIPRTARSCKRFPGFRSAARASEQRHGVTDALLAWSAFALSGAQDPTPLAKLRDCPECGQPLDSYRGFCGRSEGAEWAAGKAEQGFTTRVGISRERGASSHGILYTRDFLRAGSQFSGRWWVHDDLADSFLRFLGSVHREMPLRVGHNRTRGMGKLVLGEPAPVEADTADAVQARVARFTETLRAVAGSHARHAWYLPLTTIADCILPDGAGGFRQLLTPPVLLEEWGVATTELVYCSVDIRRVSGWNGVARLPKPDALAVAMGSVFVLAAEAPPDWKALATDQACGLGARRPEGFGAVVVADPFHWEVKNA